MTEQQTTPSLDGDFARLWVEDFVASFNAEAAVLADLDRRAGDGDFGTNLTSALGKAQAYIASSDPTTFADVFFAVSKGFLNTGGTSGPLFGMYFREIAKSASSEPTDVASLASGVTAGLDAIQRLGKAAVGDNTMVDAITPAAHVLTSAAAQGAGPEAALKAAALGARAGAESTRDLIASRGRASYVGELARGVLDPGAVAVALLFSSAYYAHTAERLDTAWLRPPALTVD